MLARLPTILDWSHWHFWIVPVAGGLAAIIAYLVGRNFMGRKPGLPPPPVDLLDPTPDPAEEGQEGMDRRRSLRRGGLVDVTVFHPMTGVELCQAWVVDRSMGGLKIVLTIEVAQGRQLRLLANRAGNQAEVRVEVRHCVQRRRREWMLGCSFVENYPLATLLSFG